MRGGRGRCKGRYKGKGKDRGEGVMVGRVMLVRDELRWGTMKASVGHREGIRTGKEIGN